MISSIEWRVTANGAINQGDIVTCTANTISSWFTFGWQHFLDSYPDIKQFHNDLHVALYRKARFIKKRLKLSTQKKRLVTTRMMLQRPTIKGVMSRR